jgi:prolyl oligopeptidase
MRRASSRAAILLAAVLFAGMSLALRSAADAADGRLTYPVTRRGDHVDDYHGTKVPDPYRWLEDPDSPETRAWVTAQNKVTFGYLESIPARKTLQERLTQLWNFERFTAPQQRGGRYFYTRNDGLQNQNVLLVAESLNGSPRGLLDPNKLSKDGTVALAGWAVSNDGQYLAYGLATAGSDWHEWKVREVGTGRDLTDDVRWVKFSSVSWTTDNRGFYYSRYDAPQPGQELTQTNYYQKLFCHRLGTPQDQDVLIYQRQDHKEWGFNGEVAEDGQYLVITVRRGTEHKKQIFFKPLADPQAPVVEWLAGFDAGYQFLGNDGKTFWLLTDADAPLRRIVAVDTDQPARAKWRVVVPEGQSVISAASVVGDRFLVTYLQDAHSRVAVYGLDGRHLGDVPLPAIGTAVGFEGLRKHTETFFSFTNYTTPPTIYRYDIPSGRTTVFRQPKVGFRPEDFVTTQVFCRSRDGTRVPMFITHRQGAKPDGSAPALLYAYGGFDIPITPVFSVTNLVWLERGGVYAVANLRGGGEYGRGWHEAGMKEKKQNVFDDFLAAAQYLVDQRYTSRQRLAIQGGSNGGLLVGAAITQRPDLFGAAVPAVGVMDMLRFHKFTIGWAWVSEYGSSDNAAEFQTLIKYSPLHNLKPVTKYPATLVTTADHDDRVVPAHSFKFAAALQHAQAGTAPVLIRIETRAGHGAGKPTSKRIQEAADVLAFLTSTLK